jgi:type VI secretion system protein ImpH
VATEARAAEHYLTHRLVTKGCNFSFFQAVQLLERHAPEAARVGYQGPASRECIRFRPDTSLAFPAADIEQIAPYPDDQDHSNRFRITTTFLGLYGSSSPLPAYFSEQILWDEGYRRNVRDFLDLFHHRLISLFYRAWTKYRYHITFKKGGADPLSTRLLSMLGLDEVSAREERAIPAIRFLRYAGALTLHPRSASVLQGVLVDFFDGLSVSVQSFQKRRVRIQEDQQNRLGARNCALGSDCTVGGTIEDCGGKIRLSLGPLSHEKFAEFLPDGKHYRPLQEILDQYLIDQMDYDTEFLVVTDDIPSMRLSSKAPAALGWNSWLLPPAGPYDSVVMQRAAG